jgi:hypothetical protein
MGALRWLEYKICSGYEMGCMVQGSSLVLKNEASTGVAGRV